MKKPCYTCERLTENYVHFRRHPVLGTLKHPHSDTEMPLCGSCAKKFTVEYRYVMRFEKEEVPF